MRINNIQIRRLIIVTGIITLLLIGFNNIQVLGETINTSEAVTADGVASSFYGETISNIGDYNLDGYEDIIVGGRQYQNWRGNTWIYFGSETGISPKADFQIVGEPNRQNSGICMGHMTANVGDINLDGYDDFAVAGPGSWGAWDVGKVYIFFGGNTQELYPTKAAFHPNITLISPIKFDWFGETMTSAGDFNGDGMPDLLVGAPGSAWVSEDGALPFSNGKAYVFLGNNQGFSASPDITLNNYENQTAFGLYIGGNGDLNNDGYDDVAISAPWIDSKKGAVYIFPGSATPDPDPTPILTLNGADNIAELGKHVEILKDLNGDGFDELGLRTKIMKDGILQPVVYIYFGKDDISTMTEPDLILNNFEVLDDFGLYFRQIEDLNNDTYPELAIGAPGLDPLPLDTTYPGKVYIYNGGPDFDNVPDTTYVGEDPADFFGYSIETADIDGDQVADLIIGSIGYGKTGRIYVYLSGDGIATVKESSPFVIIAMGVSILAIAIIIIRIKPRFSYTPK